MFTERIRQFFNRDEMPNWFSIAMGQRVREAREAKGMSQTELAEAIYKRRPSISEIENGKMYPDVQDLLLLSAHLGRPLLYFIPEFAYRNGEQTGLTEEEEELLFYFRRIQHSEQQRIAISQVRSLSEFSLTDKNSP